MTIDYFSIGHESEAAWGNSTVSKQLIPIPENKREMPCEGCEHLETCGDNGTECSAFRNWSAHGDFVDSDVARFIRGCK